MCGRVARVLREVLALWPKHALGSPPRSSTCSSSGERDWRKGACAHCFTAARGPSSTHLWLVQRFTCVLLTAPASHVQSGGGPMSLRPHIYGWFRGSQIIIRFVCAIGGLYVLYCWDVSGFLPRSPAPAPHRGTALPVRPPLPQCGAGLTPAHL